MCIMTTTLVPKITLWRVIVAVIFAAGLYSTYARFALGFSQSTHLTDPQPWGLWVGLGTLCGVGLSAGGFGIAAAVYLLGSSVTGRCCAQLYWCRSWAT